MRVTYSGPVKTGEERHGSSANDSTNFEPNSNHVLMCQTDNFTGSEAWGIESAGITQLPFKPLDIVIPKRSQICRIDLVVTQSFGGWGAEWLYLGVVKPDGTADIDWFGKASVSGGTVGVDDWGYYASPHYWVNVGTDEDGAGRDWPSPNNDARLCVSFYNNVSNSNATAYWTSSDNKVYVTDITAPTYPVKVGDPIKGLNTGSPVVPGSGGIPEGSRVTAIGSGSGASQNYYQISKTLTNTFASGSPTTINWSNATTGKVTINVYYLQDRNATPSS